MNLIWISKIAQRLCSNICQQVPGIQESPDEARKQLLQFLPLPMWRPRLKH